MSVRINIEKKLGDFELKVDLAAENEVLALLGASGCGKSMTLKCIAGIEKPDRGYIEVDGRVLFDSEKKINLSPQKRFTGLMFQNYGLFPNMTVKQNIMTGVRRTRKNAVGRGTKPLDGGKLSANSSKMSCEAAVDGIIERFGLKEVKNHFPAQISGGQQQRTALARILVSEPDILMLDEPFSALDAHLRFRMEQEVREVIKSFGKTVILVSHDRDEVYRLSDKIAVMYRGRVEAFGEKDAVFKNPETMNSAMLTGCKNISPIKKIDERHVLALDWGLILETEQDAEESRYVGIRMHDVNGTNPVNTFACKVMQEIENPFSYTIMLRLENDDTAGYFGWELSKEDWLKIQSERVDIHIPKSSILLLK